MRRAGVIGAARSLKPNADRQRPRAAAARQSRRPSDFSQRGAIYYVVGARPSAAARRGCGMACVLRPVQAAKPAGHDMTYDRSEEWRDIWSRKGLDESVPLHVINGADLLSADEWQAMVDMVSAPLALRAGDRVLECGCGAGAFLGSLVNRHDGLAISGLDYSETLLAIARRRLDGTFVLGDMRDLRAFASGSQDHVVSYSTFHYLPSPEAARAVIDEMFRVVRPGGTIYVGEVSDSAKQEQAQRSRAISHRDHKRVSAASPDHLFLPKTFFEDIAREHGASIRIVDHTDLDLQHYPVASYRYSVYMVKRGV
jgi:SAM-dependent methyltransferase